MEAVKFIGRAHDTADMPGDIITGDVLQHRGPIVIGLLFSANGLLSTTGCIESWSSIWSTARRHRHIP